MQSKTWEDFTEKDKEALLVLGFKPSDFSNENYKRLTDMKIKWNVPKIETSDERILKVKQSSEVQELNFDKPWPLEEEKGNDYY